MFSNNESSIKDNASFIRWLSESCINSYSRNVTKETMDGSTDSNINQSDIHISLSNKGNSFSEFSEKNCINLLCDPQNSQLYSNNDCKSNVSSHRSECTLPIQNTSNSSQTYPSQITNNPFLSVNKKVFSLRTPLPPQIPQCRSASPNNSVKPSPSDTTNKSTSIHRPSNCIVPPSFQCYLTFEDHIHLKSMSHSQSSLNSPTQPSSLYIPTQSQRNFNTNTKQLTQPIEVPSNICRWRHTTPQPPVEPPLTSIVSQQTNSNTIHPSTSRCIDYILPLDLSRMTLSLLEKLVKARLSLLMAGEYQENSEGLYNNRTLSSQSEGLNSNRTLSSHSEGYNVNRTPSSHSERCNINRTPSSHSERCNINRTSSNQSKGLNNNRTSSTHSDEFNNNSSLSSQSEGFSTGHTSSTHSERYSVNQSSTHSERYSTGHTPSTLKNTSSKITTIDSREDTSDTSENNPNNNKINNTMNNLNNNKMDNTMNTNLTNFTNLDHTNVNLDVKNLDIKNPFCNSDPLVTLNETETINELPGSNIANNLSSFPPTSPFDTTNSINSINSINSTNSMNSINMINTTNLMNIMKTNSSFSSYTSTPRSRSISVLHYNTLLSEICRELGRLILLQMPKKPYHIHKSNFTCPSDHQYFTESASNHQFSTCPSNHTFSTPSKHQFSTKTHSSRMPPPPWIDNGPCQQRQKLTQQLPQALDQNSSLASVPLTWLMRMDSLAQVVLCVILRGDLDREKWLKDRENWEFFTRSQLLSSHDLYYTIGNVFNHVDSSSTSSSSSTAIPSSITNRTNLRFMFNRHHLNTITKSLTYQYLNHQDFGEQNSSDNSISHLLNEEPSSMSSTITPIPSIISSLSSSVFNSGLYITDLVGLSSCSDIILSNLKIHTTSTNISNAINTSSSKRKRRRIDLSKSTQESDVYSTKKSLNNELNNSPDIPLIWSCDSSIYSNYYNSQNYLHHPPLYYSSDLVQNTVVQNSDVICTHVFSLNYILPSYLNGDLSSSFPTRSILAHPPLLNNIQYYSLPKYTPYQFDRMLSKSTEKNTCSTSNISNISNNYNSLTNPPSPYNIQFSKTPVCYMCVMDWWLQLKTHSSSALHESTLLNSNTSCLSHSSLDKYSLSQIVEDLLCEMSTPYSIHKVNSKSSLPSHKTKDQLKSVSRLHPTVTNSVDISSLDVTTVESSCEIDESEGNIISGNNSHCRNTYFSKNPPSPVLTMTSSEHLNIFTLRSLIYILTSQPKIDVTSYLSNVLSLLWTILICASVNTISNDSNHSNNFKLNSSSETDVSLNNKLNSSSETDVFLNDPIVYQPCSKHYNDYNEIVRINKEMEKKSALHESTSLLLSSSLFTNNRSGKDLSNGQIESNDDSTIFLCSSSIFDFPSLLRNKKSVGLNGRMLYLSSELSIILLTHFTSQYDILLTQQTSKPITNTPLFPLYSSLLSVYTPLANPRSVLSSLSYLNLHYADDVIPVGLVHFPPCQRYMLDHLMNQGHLKYFARVQFSIFLKDLQLPYNEAYKFFKKYMVLPHKQHQWNKYEYGFKYTYGLKGSKKNIHCFSCSTMQTVSSPGPHDCLFKKLQNTELAISLVSMSENAITVSKNRYHRRPKHIPIELSDENDTFNNYLEANDSTNTNNDSLIHDSNNIVPISLETGIKIAEIAKYNASDACREFFLETHPLARKKLSTFKTQQSKPPLNISDNHISSITSLNSSDISSEILSGNIRVPTQWYIASQLSQPKCKI